MPPPTRQALSGRLPKTCSPAAVRSPGIRGPLHFEVDIKRQWTRCAVSRSRRLQAQRFWIRTKNSRLPYANGQSHTCRWRSLGYLGTRLGLSLGCLSPEMGSSFDPAVTETGIAQFRSQVRG